MANSHYPTVIPLEQLPQVEAVLAGYEQRLNNESSSSFKPGTISWLRQVQFNFFRAVDSTSNTILSKYSFIERLPLRILAILFLSASLYIAPMKDEGLLSLLNRYLRDPLNCGQNRICIQLPETCEEIPYSPYCPSVSELAELMLEIQRIKAIAEERSERSPEDLSNWNNYINLNLTLIVKFITRHGGFLDASAIEFIVDMLRNVKDHTTDQFELGLIDQILNGDHTNIAALINAIIDLVRYRAGYAISNGINTIYIMQALNALDNMNETIGYYARYINGQLEILRFELQREG